MGAAYFGAYIVIWGLVYGAAGMSASALPLAALFPFAPLWFWAVASGVVGLVFVWLNRYPSFERMMAALAGVMFVTGVGLAAAMPPAIGDVASGIAPTLPPGSASTHSGSSAASAARSRWRPTATGHRPRAGPIRDGWA